MAQDNLHMKFLALNVDFCCARLPKFIRLAHAGVKKGCPLKVIILPILTRLA